MAREQAESPVAGGLLFDHSPAAKEEGVGGSGVRWDRMGAVSAKSARETTPRTLETLALR